MLNLSLNRLKSWKKFPRKGLFTLNGSIIGTVTLMGGTFDLFDRHCDGQNGLHTHFVRQHNICYEVTESHGVKDFKSL